MKQNIVVAITLAAALVGGCASETPLVDAQLGKSVEQMIRSQTYDPAAAANPPELAPDIGDGQRLKNVLDAYRKDNANGEHVEKSPEFEAGK